MNKHKLYHVWTTIRVVRPVYFLAAALVCGAVFVFAYRQNNLNMIKLREAVYQADARNGDVETALRDLREYIYGHMNTNLAAQNGVYPPLQLKYRYERLIAARQAQLAADNSKIYTEAQADCERRIPQGYYGGGRIPCIQEYIASRQLQGSQAAIPDSLYKFDFVSPRWSPDLAGWSLVATVIFGLLFLMTNMSGWWLRQYFRE